VAAADARSFLSSLEQIGIKLGLDQIRVLVRLLDHPDRAFRSIIVAGTNGKGSVTAMIERGLRAAGYRTGRYTSPHLVQLEERFAIDGVSVAPVELDAAIERLRAASAGLPAPASYFEATTAIAFDLFRRARVDVALLEVGLGGRLDATNVVEPVAAAITLVDFDHQEYLGGTLEAIAAEKAAVVKPGMLVVLGANPPVVDAVVAARCAAQHARLVRAVDGTSATPTVHDGLTILDLATPVRRYSGMRLALRGTHQVQNATTAVRLLEQLHADTLFAVPEHAIRLAVETVEWPGRLELMRRGRVDVLIDGAHNPSGARALASYVSDTYGRRVPMVVGVMRDKQIDAMLEALGPVASPFVFTAPATPRAASPDSLAEIARRVVPAVPVLVAPHPVAALDLASREGSPVVVAGSLYLAGEVRTALT
jgi:dihydrofolate synthase/folylpolyglutamate synthase